MTAIMVMIEVMVVNMKCEWRPGGAAERWVLPARRAPAPETRVEMMGGGGEKICGLTPQSRIYVIVTTKIGDWMPKRQTATDSR